MNLTDKKYSQYALVHETTDTVDHVQKLDPACTNRTGGW